MENEFACSQQQSDLFDINLTSTVNQTPFFSGPMGLGLTPNVVEMQQEEKKEELVGTPQG